MTPVESFGASEYRNVISDDIFRLFWESSPRKSDIGPMCSFVSNNVSPGRASAFSISFSSLFLPTINFVLPSNRKCLPIFSRSISFVVGVSVCRKRSFARIANLGSVSRQPPPAFGGSTKPNCSAIFHCSFLVRPRIMPRFSRLIIPRSSGSVFGNNAPESGLTIFPSSPDSFSIVLSAGPCCDIGRCPSTSPEMINSAPISSITCFPALNIIARQSIQGFIPEPNPCFGCFSIWM